MEESKKSFLNVGNKVNTDEIELLHAFLNGNDFAYTAIYNRYVDKLFAYGTSMGFERETLKDAIHDVFYKLYFKRNLLKEVNNLQYYLFRMLKNRLLDIYKSSIDSNDISQYEMHFSMKVTMLDDLIQREDKIIIQEKINHLLECLTNRQREAIYLRFIHEMEYEEVGKLLDMTPMAARKLIARAMKRIREHNASVALLFLLMFHPV